jgi:hypothetical protein
MTLPGLEPQPLSRPARSQSYWCLWANHICCKLDAFYKGLCQTLYEKIHNFENVFNLQKEEALFLEKTGAPCKTN